MMKYEKRKCLNGHNFTEYLKREKSGDIKVKLIGLRLVQEGKKYTVVAKILKTHRKTVENWVNQFAVKEWEGLRRKPGQGRKRRLQPEFHEKFKNRVIELQAQRIGGRIRGNDVKELLEKEFSVKYEKSAVYDLLKEVGLVWISSRSKHPAGNQEAQEAFKKTSRTK